MMSLSDNQLPREYSSVGLPPCINRYWLAIWTCTWSLVLITSTQLIADLPLDLSALGIEELMEIEVTTVSKKEQKLFESPAAVYVITKEEIHRSGFTSIPEALRLAPGLQVARLDANKWAITARGFNGRFANKLLVLIDGRIVYTSLFSGVFWEVQDLLLEDVERIEVIRGPGATLWGANAVNGIINIITRHARHTQGVLMQTGAGSEERGFASLRYGGRLGGDTYYRVYARYFDRDHFVDAVGDPTADAWSMWRSGFRLDRDTPGPDALILIGDIYAGDLGQTMESIPSREPPYSLTFDFDTDVAGASLLGRWQRTFSADADMSLGLFFDRSTRRDATLDEVRHTLDVDFQHRFALSAQQDVVWGAGYRLTSDRIDSTFLSIDPPSRQVQIFSGFAQTEIGFPEKCLTLTLGSKLEHNDFTGVEILPNARLLWTPGERHAAWMAISRAVRLPTRAVTEGRFTIDVSPPNEFPGSPLLFYDLMGNPDPKAEELLAFEVGYRLHPRDDLSVDLATFYNGYDHLITGEPQILAILADNFVSPPRFTIPVLVDDKMQGETLGMELAVDWQPLASWRLRAAYTFLHMDLEIEKDSLDPLTAKVAEDIPTHQFNLRSALDLPGDLELDLIGRYVDSLPRSEADAYLGLDARVGWFPFPQLELSLVGQNLLDSHHLEFDTELIETLSTQIQRSAYGMLTWRF